VIIYDLRCEKHHTFEGWFNDRGAFETQRENRLVICPVCGSTDITQVLSTIATISNSDGRGHPKTSKELSPLMALKMYHDYLDKEFVDVGDRFAEMALNIHRGEEEKQNIKGITTKEEEELLREEGVRFIKVPVPKFDS
jgi:hypothetical protein